MPKTKQEWQTELEQLLKVPEEEVLRRNAAITAQYATWYTAHPDVFKWAGAAAFASDRVGLILAFHKAFAVTDKAIKSTADFLSKEKEAVPGSHDLNVIRQTNNAVFADIGWAHLAYSSPAGGLGAVEAGLPVDSLMLEGFKTIDRGKQSAAEDLIWQGNLLLLKHEQSVTVQAHFARLQQPVFKQFLSSATDIDFDANNFQVDPKTHTSFHQYILPFLPLGALPDITNFEQRWRWVENEVWRIWKTVETTDQTLPNKMAMLRKGA